MRATLADGTRVHCMQPFEARVIDRDIAGYFTHGIAIAPGDTVLDLGANIGLFGLRASQRCGGDLALYCVEPIPQLCELLARNLGSRATIVPWAIGASSGTVELEYFPLMAATSGVTAVIPDDARWAELVEDTAHKKLGGLARLVPRAVYAFISRRMRGLRQRVRCESGTITQLIELHGLERIALIKLDIEGAELAALQGVSEAHWPRIAQIVAEIHDRRRDLAEITRLLERHGFVVTIQERDCVDDDCCNLYALRA